MKEELLLGFQRSRCNISFISIIPMKMIESWLLSDPQSFKKSFKGKPPIEISMHPELEWGDKKDPSSDYPKNKLKRILAQYNQIANRETFVSLAENSDLQLLRQKCPISFEDFYLQYLQAVRDF